MIALDIKTLFFSSIILLALSVFVMFPVWWQNRTRSPEIALWLISTVMQWVAAVLFTLRGTIPDLLSVIGANALVVGGTIVLIIGLERYVDRRSSQVHNYLMFTVYLGIHSYFTFVQPNLEVRNINSSVVLVLLALQGSWLLLRRVDPAMRAATRGPGIVFLGFMALYAAKIPFNLFLSRGTDFLDSGPVDSLMIISSHVLLVALTLGLLLMVNQRLVSALEQDIAERELAQAALALSEEKFATAFHTSPDAVNINRLSDGMYLEVNEGFAELTGYSARDVAGKTSAEIHIWHDTADRDRLVAALSAGGIVNNLEAEFRRKDGTVTTALMSARLIDVDGDTCILSVTRDISARKAAESEILRLNEDLEQRVQERTEELTAANEELIETNNRLDEATRAKSDFLASMSHELRTPLNSIIGFSHILANGLAGDLAPEQEKQVRMVNTSGKHLLELVNQVLDLSAVEAGRLKIQHEPVNVSVLVQRVVESLAPLAAEKSLNLSWDVSPDVGALVSDHVRLEQVLLNLLGNAVKFTDAGSIRLEVARSDDEVVFVVNDTGCGIAKRDHARVFDEFYQAQRDNVAKSDGTGLGLTVSRGLLDMLGGTIAVQSRLGAGSTFTVRLPSNAYEPAGY